MLPLSLRSSLFLERTLSQIKFLGKRQSLLSKYIMNCSCTSELVRGKRDVSSIKPRTLKKNKDEVNIGSELAAKISKTNVAKILMELFSRPELTELAHEEGLDDMIISSTKSSFSTYCSQVNDLPTDLYIVLSDLVGGHGHVLDLSPYFLKHAQHIFPHLKYKEELSSIGDLTDPANCYTVARSIKRKLFFHYGPTNSGKTYSAMKRFMEAKKAIYCAPLKLLAHEIYEKVNENNIPCDLVTGDDVRRAHGTEKEADHISCTIEMASVSDVFDVAVIDEIQMVKDPSRGAAWTRALLGLAAKEIHLCGEEVALNFIKLIAKKLDEDLECHHYKRLTKLYLEDKAVGNFRNIRDGDCIICFSRKDIYKIMCELEKIGKKCAVIYGTLPPAVKTAQSKKFNDPKSTCNALVATDAVGLGMNLNIRRIVFFKLEKKGDQNGHISVSLARQIAGRAGRYGSIYREGYVTTFWNHDLQTLKSLFSSEPEPVRQAGLIPSPEQIELFSYFLPGLNLPELLDIFSSLSKTDDSLYFMCDMSSVKRLAEQLKHIPLSVKTMFAICSAPVNMQSLMVQTLFTKESFFAKKLSNNEITLCSFMKTTIKWPLKKPSTTAELTFLEEAFDCLDLYLWFWNRFPINFPECEEVRALQATIDTLISEGIADLLQLIIKDGSEKKVVITEEKIGEDLIQRGILTPSMLAQLKQEWESEMDEKTRKSNSKSSVRNRSKDKTKSKCQENIE